MNKFLMWGRFALGIYYCIFHKDVTASIGCFIMSELMERK